MSDTVEHGIAETNTDTSSATARVRVSLREIRECTFRASSWLTWSAIDGRRKPVRITDHASEAQASPRSEPTGPIVLGDQGGNRLLRHLPLATHLAAAEPGRGVYVPGDMSEVACGRGAHRGRGGGWATYRVGSGVPRG